MNRMIKLRLLCEAHKKGYTSNNSSFVVEFMTIFLAFSNDDLHLLSDWISQMPQNGDGA